MYVTLLRSLTSLIVFYWVVPLLAQTPPYGRESQLTPPVFSKLKTDLSSKHSKVGKQVELEIIRPPGAARDESGFPKHTRLIGTITMVHRASKNTLAEVSIHIKEARWKGGSTEFDLTLTEIMVTHSHSTIRISGGDTHLSGRPTSDSATSTWWTPFGGNVKPISLGEAVIQSRDDFYLFGGETTMRFAYITWPDRKEVSGGR